MVLKGQAHKYGANVDTDVIIPARYLNVSEPTELARHCMEDIDPEFVKKVKKGDIIVAGANFGCGSSREHAPLSIKSQVCHVLSPAASLAFFSATLSTSVFHFWNALSLWKKSTAAIHWRLTSPAAK